MSSEPLNSLNEITPFNWNTILPEILEHFSDANTSVLKDMWKLFYVESPLENGNKLCILERNVTCASQYINDLKYAFQYCIHLLQIAFQVTEPSHKTNVFQLIAHKLYEVSKKFNNTSFTQPYTFHLQHQTLSITHPPFTPYALGIPFGQKPKYVTLSSPFVPSTITLQWNTILFDELHVQLPPPLNVEIASTSPLIQPSKFIKYQNTLIYVYLKSENISKITSSTLTLEFTFKHHETSRVGALKQAIQDTQSGTHAKPDGTLNPGTSYTLPTTVFGNIINVQTNLKLLQYNTLTIPDTILETSSTTEDQSIEMNIRLQKFNIILNSYSKTFIYAEHHASNIPTLIPFEKDPIAHNVEKVDPSNNNMIRISYLDHDEIYTKISIHDATYPNKKLALFLYNTTFYVPQNRKMLVYSPIILKTFTKNSAPYRIILSGTVPTQFIYTVEVPNIPLASVTQYTWGGFKYAFIQDTFRIHKEYIKNRIQNLINQQHKLKDYEDVIQTESNLLQETLDENTRHFSRKMLQLEEILKL